MKRALLIAFLSVLALTVVISAVVALAMPTRGNNENAVLGENATITTPEGDYSIEIMAVYADTPNPATDREPEAERVAVVVYEYTNTGVDNGLSIGETHFRAYDKSGKELKLYRQNGIFEVGTAETNGTHTASVAFALNHSENYLKIEYYNDPASNACDMVSEQTW